MEAEVISPQSLHTLDPHDQDAYDLGLKTTSGEQFRLGSAESLGSRIEFVLQKHDLPPGSEALIRESIFPTSTLPQDYQVPKKTEMQGAIKVKGFPHLVTELIPDEIKRRQVVGAVLRVLLAEQFRLKTDTNSPQSISSLLQLIELTDPYRIEPTIITFQPSDEHLSLSEDHSYQESGLKLLDLLKEQTNSIIKFSQQPFKGIGSTTIGEKALMKKIGHTQNMGIVITGLKYVSMFSSLINDIPKTGRTKNEDNQNFVEGLITQILTDPLLVIKRSNFIDVFGTSGVGLSLGIVKNELGSENLTLRGLIDPPAYCKK